MVTTGYFPEIHVASELSGTAAGTKKVSMKNIRPGERGWKEELSPG